MNRRERDEYVGNAAKFLNVIATSNMKNFKEQAREDMYGRFYKVSESDSVWLDSLIDTVIDACIADLPKRTDPHSVDWDSPEFGRIVGKNEYRTQAISKLQALKESPSDNTSV